MPIFRNPAVRHAAAHALVGARAQMMQGFLFLLALGLSLWLMVALYALTSPFFPRYDVSTQLFAILLIPLLGLAWQAVRPARSHAPG